LAAATGVPLPDGVSLDGDDVRAVLTGEAIAVRPQRFWQCNRYAPRIEGNAAMRDGDWKLVRPAIPDLMRVTEPDRAADRALNYRQPGAITSVDTSPLPEFDAGQIPEPLLFDLASDPFEEHDLASGHPDRVRWMSDALDGWFESVERDRAGALASGGLG
jgi:arylsulfatase A